MKILTFFGAVSFSFILSISLPISPISIAYSGEISEASFTEKDFLRQEKKVVKLRLQEIKLLIKEARSLHKRKKYSEALELLEGALRLDPTHSAAQKLKSKVEAAQLLKPISHVSDEEISRAMVETLEEMEGKGLDVLYARAKGHYKKKQYLEAIKLLEAVLGKDDKHKGSRKLLRKVKKKEEMARKKQKKAIGKLLKELEKDLAKEKRDPRLEASLDHDLEEQVQYHFKRGKKYFDGGQYQEAVDEFQRARQIDPNHFLAPEIFNYIKEANGKHF
jgi:tetratricopeptide (TPR) repeat protein